MEIRPFRSFTRIVGRLVMTTVIVLFAILLILTGILAVNSSGKPRPFLDETGNVLPGSISEKIFVNINGVDQGMFIKGRNVDNPVLLYLHGGMPEYFLSEKYPNGLEDIFTVVWWEQRGSGMSFDARVPKESITLEQLIADTLAVTDYLRNRFQREKIYLLGHSGGSFLGIQAAKASPERFYAYIGVAQMVNPLKSENLVYGYMLQEFKANGNRKMAQKLEGAPVTMEAGIPAEYLAVRDVAMHSLGIGTTRDMKSIVTGLFLPSLMFREYSLKDKFNLWRGKVRNGVSIMWEKSLSMDLSQQVTELDLPVYLLEGAYDYTCNYTLAREYYEKIAAPVKGFYTFEKSAHCPIFEEPQKAMQILQEDVLSGQTLLSDEE